MADRTNLQFVLSRARRLRPARLALAAVVFYSLAPAVLRLDPARADDSPPPATAPTAPTAPPTDPAVLDALRRPISVSFRRVPLEQALRRVGQAAGAPVAPDWDWLKNVGFPRDEPVTLRLRDVPAEHVVGLLLRAARPGGTAPVWARGGEIRVGGSPEAEPQDLVARTYAVLPRPWLAFPADERADRLRDWHDLITQTIAPDIWEETGGNLGGVREAGLSLVVTTTPQIHRRVADLLSQVATASGARAAAPPDLARRAGGRRMTFDVDAVPLAQALYLWQTAAAVNVFVDYNALEGTGVDFDRLVSVHAAGATPGQVLAAIVKAAQGDAPRTDEDGGDAAADRPSIVARTDAAGVLVVGPPDSLPPEATTVRCYNLRPVISRRSRAFPIATTAEDRMQGVCDWLVRNVDPDTWREAGGSVGAMKVLGDVLIVTQTPDAHDRIAAALWDRPWDRAVQPPEGDGDAGIDPQTGQAGSR